MNRKQFIFLIIIVVIIGGAAWWHHQNQTALWSNADSSAGQKLLGNFQVNDVAAIKIQQGTNVLELAKKNGIWTVAQRNDYPADFSKISQLLLKLRDLKIVQTESVDESQLPELNLSAPDAKTNSATLLAFYGVNGKPLRELRLGLEHQHEGGSGPNQQSWPDGRYVLTNSNSTTVAVISDALDEVNPQPESWLDKIFFKIEKPKNVAVNFLDATNSWKLTRTNETGDWNLADAKSGEHLDTSIASEAADAFSSPSFTDVLPGKDGNWHDATKVNVGTFDGFQYALTVGDKTNDNYFLKVKTSFTPPSPPKMDTTNAVQKAAEEKVFADNLKNLKDKFHQEKSLNDWTYVVPQWTLESLLKKRSQLLVVESATNAPSTKAK